jgi:hypothetical protein
MVWVQNGAIPWPCTAFRWQMGVVTQTCQACDGKDIKFIGVSTKGLWQVAEGQRRL